MEHVKSTAAHKNVLQRYSIRDSDVHPALGVSSILNADVSLGLCIWAVYTWLSPGYHSIKTLPYILAFSKTI